MLIDLSCLNRIIDRVFIDPTWELLVATVSHQNTIKQKVDASRDSIDFEKKNQIDVYRLPA